MNTDPLIQKIKILNIEYSNKKVVLDKFSKDASIFTISPRVVFFPKNKDEIMKIFDFVIEWNNDPFIKDNNKLSISNFGAGTDMSGGPLGDSVIISHTKYLNKIIEWGEDKDGDYVVLEPGVFYRDYEKIADSKGLLYPSYPASKDLVSWGGIIANNSGGEKNLKHGKTDSFIQEVEMLCSDGKIYNFKELAGQELQEVCNRDDFYGKLHREILDLIKNNLEIIDNNTPIVKKNSSGYYLWKAYNREKNSINLSKIICGSQGTLGIITKIKVKLIKKDTYSSSFVLFLSKTDNMALIIQELLKHNPDSLELYDDHTFRIAMKYLPNIIAKMKGNIFNLFWQFIPEFKMVLTRGIPKIIIICEWTENNRDILDTNIRDTLEKLKDTKNKYGFDIYIPKNDLEMQKYWTFRRESFNLLRQKVKDLRTVPFVDDVVVPIEYLQDFIPQFEKILDEEKILYTIAGHAGDGNIHVIPLMTLKEENTISLLKSVMNKVFTLIQKYKGSTSGEHNDGLIRSSFMKYMFSEDMISLFRKCKKIFDPENVFNPNKKLDVSWDYSVARIDRTK